ncbi:MAG: hypothetical protein K2L86_15125 [Lachnospiraceae bacterium]|nr:hypothetical protein [Lachnospiraceae bacterium]
MIQWLHQEEGCCEGIFKSTFFRDDEDGDELSIGVQSPDLSECAEKCVEAFNNLTESQILQICKEIISCAQECGDEEFELPELDHALDILKYCWFTTVYVNMLSKEDEISYVVEGEGDWGNVIGFAVKNNQVIYVGTDYFDYMKRE